MKPRERGGSDRYHLRPMMQLASTFGTGAKSANKRQSKWAIRRNKKKKTDDCSDTEWRPWDDLPEELLEIISNSLNIADYLSFGKVCTSWRLFYSETKKSFMASQSPLVLYISTRAKKTCYFYDITTEIRYETKLPYLACNFCLGFSSGYLIMEDLLSKVWLVNPVTGHQLQFSRMPQPRNAIYCSDRAIFGSIGTEPECYVVVVISTMHQNLRFCISRDNEWKEHSYAKKPWYVLDIVVFCGRIFVMTNDYQIGVFNLNSSDLMFLKLKFTPRLSNYVRFVVTNGRLLIIDFIPLYRLGIYTIDFSRMEWARIRNLGDQSLFLGDMMCSRSSDATKWGGRSNCVYYLPFMSNTCFLYSMTGAILGTLPVVKGAVTPRMNCWYFLHQSYSIDKIKYD